MNFTIEATQCQIIQIDSFWYIIIAFILGVMLEFFWSLISMKQS